MVAELQGYLLTQPVAGVILTGEFGVGKTALAQHVLDNSAVLWK
ncbi:ATP-binding protein [Paeniglutamicibacter antarcticus]|uniref:ATP-binding protein n=1 Tax=Arthrobacter terrae TaxID=2935737 RepID=A0A931G604_9MICC|nr:ATP-binding protein [Arthrobacter terrae]MBG0740125.1 ATP-binding protein [Arthrobacter terrae]